MLKISFGSAKLLLTKKARGHPKETLDSIQGDLRARNSYSSLDRPNSKSTENVGNLQSLSYIREPVRDTNGDTTGLTIAHHATLNRGCIEAQSMQVIRVQAILYNGPPSQYTAKYRAEIYYNGEMEIRELKYQELKHAEGGREALESFKPSWR